MVAQSQPWGCQIAVKKLETSNIAAKPPLIIFIFGEKIDVFAKTKESITQGFSKHFYCHYLMVKAQSSIEFQSSILHLLSF